MKTINIVTLGPSLEEKGGMGSVAKLIAYIDHQDVNITHISTWDSDLNKLELSLLFLRAILDLLRLLAVDRVDMVHVHISERGSLVRKAIISSIVWLFDKPVIIHAHGCEFHIFYRKLSKPGRYLVDVFLQRCSRLIVLSDSWKQFYIDTCKLNPNQVVTLKNPVIIPPFITSKSYGKETINFLFMGKINQRKGVYDIVKAIYQMSSRDRARVNILLAGSGEIDQLTEFAESLGVAENLTFLGWVTPQEREKLLSDADAFILPSYNEGLPMALLEAMACALPSITTPVGGIPEVISHYESGLLVNPGNIGELVSAMSLLINNPDLRCKIGNRGRESIIGLDIENYKDKLLDLYRESIKARAADHNGILAD